MLFRRSPLSGYCLLPLLIALSFSVSVDAQYTTASLGGLVTDPSSAAVPGAQVTVRNLDTGFTQNAITGPEGQFQFSRLPVGNYELKVEQSGFNAYTRSGIRLTVDQMATQNVALQVGQPSNTDVGLLKDTVIKERVSLQFRAEAFNVFNNPNFRLPNSNASSAQFGLITAVIDDNQRILQLGLKLSF